MNDFNRITALISHRIFSISHSFLLCRKPCNIMYSENDYCRFEIIKDVKQLEDCGAFEDPNVYIPIYRNMITNGGVVVFGYRKEDDKCFFRACVLLRGAIKCDGCFVKELDENEGYIHYVYCDSLHRGHGAHNSAMQFICSKLKDYTLYAIVETNNMPSLKGFYRNGFASKEKLARYNIGGIRIMVRKEA